MYNAFRKEPKFDTYQHVVPDVNLKAVNLVRVYPGSYAAFFMGLGV
jgi:hypothetical protein